VTGVARGLQSRRWVDKVQGGFDSHSPPPFLVAHNEGWNISAL